jgi:hypothetical protein
MVPFQHRTFVEASARRTPAAVVMPRIVAATVTRQDTAVAITPL